MKCIVLGYVIAASATAAWAVAQESQPAPTGGQAVQGAPVLNYDVPPKPIRIPRPEYPASALESGVEGTVLIEILIDERGRVAHARILHPIAGLNEAALACVKKWRFKPAQKHARPVPTIAQAPVTFKRPAKQNDRT